ncbi:MAG: aspartate-semialdehyde dehydrogenase [Bacteroidetes bacterium]|nr:MAG: aspartate-semialdehyde dehydrogenase [Bacteroidota bacterium]
MKLAVVGVTGLVGRMILKVLEEHAFPVNQLFPVASPKSIGQMVRFHEKVFRVTDHLEAIREKPDIAIFSAGSCVSREWAPRYAEAGIRVIDNSSAWRMDPAVPLIVPEINAHILTPDHTIIANPNCSTIQLVLVLAPLHARYTVKRVVVSTYQSVSGTGARGVRQLENERKGIAGEMAYPHQIDLNLFPHGGAFQENGYTAEEMKLVDETRKILNDPTIMVSPTIVRVPVLVGHAEAVNIEFAGSCDIREVCSLLSDTPGVVIQDDVQHNLYPMPILAEGKDEVFVGRIRADDSRDHCINLFIVSDNLRKGAATNAVQIADYLRRHVLR